MVGSVAAEGDGSFDFSSPTESILNLAPFHLTCKLTLGTVPTDHI
jgi:hypothetical protein